MVTFVEVVIVCMCMCGTKRVHHRAGTIVRQPLPHQNFVRGDKA